jgi:hypothetical protein
MQRKSSPCSRYIEFDSPYNGRKELTEIDIVLANMKVGSTEHVDGLTQ